MIYFSHPGSAKRGGRVVTDVEAGSDGRFRLRLTSAGRSGRQNRVVPIPRRWDQACGTFIPQATEARKPGTPGRARISRKPLRRECRLFRLPCRCLRAQSALLFARKACGCGQHPVLPAPLIERDGTFRKARTPCAARTKSHAFFVMTVLWLRRHSGMRAQHAGPESITTAGGYGFRALASRAPE